MSGHWIVSDVTESTKELSADDEDASYLFRGETFSSLNKLTKGLVSQSTVRENVRSEWLSGSVRRNTCN